MSEILLGAPNKMHEIYYILHYFSHLHPFHWNKPGCCSAFHSWPPLKVSESIRTLKNSHYMLKCIKWVYNTCSRILFLYLIRKKNPVKLLSKHRFWFQKEFSAFLANNLLKLKHKPMQPAAWNWSQSDAARLQRCETDFCRSASLYTPTHKGALQLGSLIHCSLLYMTAKWPQGGSGNRLGFSLLSTTESSKKWTIHNLKINLYKAQNCQEVSSNCSCHCLDHKIFTP